MLRNVETIDWSHIADELRRKREAQPVIDWIGFFEELERRKAAQRFVSSGLYFDDELQAELEKSADDLLDRARQIEL